MQICSLNCKSREIGSDLQSSKIKKKSSLRTSVPFCPMKSSKINQFLCYLRWISFLTFCLKINFCRFYVHAFADRDTTVGEGFFINNEHFDVHRFHPPLVYGRRGGPDDGEGIALCRVKPKHPKGAETYQFLLITYLLPILSAKAVPQMVKFCETNLGNPE